MRKTGSNRDFDYSTRDMRLWLDVERRPARKDRCLILMEGDSMEPTLRAGDILLVDCRDVTAQRDGIYILRADNTLLVKRLQRLPGRRLKISSDNPAYVPFELDLKQQTDEFVIVGRAVGVGRRI